MRTLWGPGCAFAWCVTFAWRVLCFAIRGIKVSIWILVHTFPRGKVDESSFSFSAGRCQLRFPTVHTIVVSFDKSVSWNHVTWTHYRNGSGASIDPWCPIRRHKILPFSKIFLCNHAWNCTPAWRWWRALLCRRRIALALRTLTPSAILSF